MQSAAAAAADALSLISFGCTMAYMSFNGGAACVDGIVERGFFNVRIDMAAVRVYAEVDATIKKYFIKEGEKVFKVTCGGLHSFKCN